MMSQVSGRRRAAKQVLVGMGPQPSGKKPGNSRGGLELQRKQATQEASTTQSLHATEHPASPHQVFEICIPGQLSRGSGAIDAEVS